VGTHAVGTSAQGAVALSADGNTAIVGGWGDNDGTGAFWTYTRSNGVWSQLGEKVTATGARGKPQFGGGVALSGDGKTAIVSGAEYHAQDGAAWIFTRDGSVWTQRAKLVGRGAVGRAFLGPVAMSADGNTAMVGGSLDNSETGAVWVYTRDRRGDWHQQGGKLVGVGAAGKARQGGSVALSADGSTAIIGGSHDNSFKGAVWIFVRNGDTWTQQGDKLAGEGSAGFAVALSADGNNAIVGEPADSDLAANYDKRLTLVDPHRPRALIAPLHLTETQKQI
jgi:hypothetical protein